MQMTVPLKYLIAEIGRDAFKLNDKVTLHSTQNTYTIIRISENSVTLER